MAAGLLFLLLLACHASRAAEPLSLFGPALEHTPVTTYVGSTHESAPASYDALPGWLQHQRQVPSVNMLGGDFLLVTHFSPTRSTSSWSVALADTWYHSAHIVILGDDGSRQAFTVQQRADSELLRFYGVTTTLEPGHAYTILVSVSAPFFTALPRIDVQTLASYKRRTANQTALVLGTLGLLCGLGIFVLFIGLWIRERSYQLYGLQALTLALGWASFFGLPTGWLGLDTGPLNFTLWFIALPIVHSQFTICFLGLRERTPRLARLGDIIALVSAVCLPLALIFPALAFVIATALVAIVLLFSLSSGVWALAHGVRQARFFTVALLGVLLPGTVILPTNFGLMPGVFDNSELLTLIGTGCEAMLQAFALADYVKLLSEARERYRKGMEEAIKKASIDALTGLGNRLAFNVLIEEITNRPSRARQSGAVQIAMIDLDGLKHINDSHGHARGDDLLRAAGSGLARIAGVGTRVFRVGGDEFAMITFGDELSLQRLSRTLSELDRSLRENGFAGAGISFGLASAPDGQPRLSSAALAELVRQADRAMYAQKSRRQEARAGGLPVT